MVEHGDDGGSREGNIPHSIRERRVKLSLLSCVIQVCVCVVYPSFSLSLSHRRFLHRYALSIEVDSYSLITLPFSTLSLPYDSSSHALSACTTVSVTASGEDMAFFPTFTWIRKAFSPTSARVGASRRASWLARR